MSDLYVNEFKFKINFILLKIELLLLFEGI